MSLYHRLHGEEKTETPTSDTRNPKLVAVRNEVHAKLIDELGPDLDDKRLESTEMRRMVSSAVERVLQTIRTPLSVTERKDLIDDLVDDVVGYGPLDTLLRDESVSDILVNGPYSVYVEKSGVVEKSSVTFADTAHLRRVIDKIVSEVGRRIDESSPLCDARLPDGSRVNAIIAPLCTDGPYLTIRKFTEESITINNLIEWGTLTVAAARFLQACVLARLNIVVAGGSGSGKTTTLNVLSSFFPDDERIVTIEDAKELQLPQDHVLALESRPPNVEGTGEVRIRELVKNSLRMRPDRIVVGECRGGEALDMLQAMNTGHDGSLTSVHANGPDEACSRLETLVLMAGYDLPVKAIRDQLSSAVELMVQMTRLRDGTRKITQITEIRGMDIDNNVITEDIFIFDMGMGWDDDGKHRGRLKATGSVPRFAQRFVDMGISLPDDTFKGEAITRRISAPRVYGEEIVESDITTERARKALTAGKTGSIRSIIPTRLLLEPGLLDLAFDQAGGKGVDQLVHWANHRLFDFLAAYTMEPDAISAWLAETTLALGEPGKRLISHARANALSLVTKLSGARSILEVGTFTGYATMAMARAADGDCTIITCDTSEEEWTSMAREAWEKAGVNDVIDVRSGSPIDTVRSMPETPHLDLVFFDADPAAYVELHEALVPRLKPGGVILVDDALMGGAVIAPGENDEALALRTYAAHALADVRLEGAVLPMAEGMLLLRRR